MVNTVGSADNDSATDPTEQSLLLARTSQSSAGGNDGNPVELRQQPEDNQPGNIASSIYKFAPIAWQIFGAASVVACTGVTLYQHLDEIGDQAHPHDAPLSVTATGTGLVAIVYLSTLAKAASNKLKTRPKWMITAGKATLFLAGTSVGTACTLIALKNAKDHIPVGMHQQMVPKGLEQNLANLGRTAAFASFAFIGGLPRKIQWIPVNLSAIASTLAITFFGGLILPNGGWPNPNDSTELVPITTPEASAMTYFYLSALSIYILGLYAFVATNQQPRKRNAPTIDKKENRNKYLGTTFNDLVEKVDTGKYGPNNAKWNLRTVMLFLAGEQIPKAILSITASVVAVFGFQNVYDQYGCSSFFNKNGNCISENFLQECNQCHYYTVWNDTLELAGSLLAGSFIFGLIGASFLALKQRLQILHPTKLEYDHDEEEYQAKVDPRVQMIRISLIVVKFAAPVLASYLVTIRAPEDWSMVRHPAAVGSVGGLMTLGMMFARLEDSKETHYRHQILNKIDHIVATFLLGTYSAAWICGAVQEGVPDAIKAMIALHLGGLILSYGCAVVMGNLYRSKPSHRVRNEIRFLSNVVPWIPLAGYISVRAAGHMMETKTSVPSYFGWACLGLAFGNSMGEIANESSSPDLDDPKRQSSSHVQYIVSYFTTEHVMKLVPIAALYIAAYTYFGILISGDVRT